MVEEPEERELPVAEDDEEGSEQVEEPGEVEDVGPEEDTAGGSHPKRETKQPLERGCSVSPPEPACVDSLCFCGEEHADESGDGDEGHGEGVDRREGAERDGAAAAKEFEDEVECDRGGDVE